MAKHTTEQSCISEYKNMVRAAGLQTVETEKKGCVTPFHYFPRNKDQKRRWLTFLIINREKNVVKLIYKLRIIFD